MHTYRSENVFWKGTIDISTDEYVHNNLSKQIEEELAEFDETDPEVVHGQIIDEINNFPQYVRQLFYNLRKYQIVCESCTLLDFVMCKKKLIFVFNQSY